MNESTKEHTTNTVLLRIIRRRISHSVRSLLLYVVPSAGNRRVLKPTVILQLNVGWRSPYHRNMHENPLAQVLCSQTSFVQVKVKPHRRYSYQPSKRNADRVFVFYVVGCFYLLMWNRLCVSVWMCASVCLCISHVSLFFLHFFISCFGLNYNLIRGWQFQRTTIEAANICKEAPDCICIPSDQINRVY